MAAKHIEIARTQGAKAGFKAYIETLERAGLPQVREALAEVRDQGNKKAQFDFYCQKFGAKFGNAQAVEVEDDSEVSVLKAQVDALVARIGSLTSGTKRAKVEGGRSGARVEAPAATTTPKATKNAQFRAWAVRKHEIPTTVGSKFSYVGKHRTTKFQVVKVTGKGDAQVVEAKRI